MPSLNQIVIIHDSVEARGGATGLARLAALEYRKRGFKVSYLTGESGDEELAQAGIHVQGLGQSKLKKAGAVGAVTKGFHNESAKDLIAGWIERNDTPSTAYHLHNWAQILSPAVFAALKPVEERTIVSCHDFFNVCPNGGLLNFQTGNICTLKPMSAGCWASQCDRRNSFHKYWRMARQLRLNALAGFAQSQMTFVCLNAGMEQVMRAAGFKAPKLMNNPNPADGYTTERVAAEQNREFLFIGRLNAEKGADIAARAAHISSFPLVMAGEGEMMDGLVAKYPGIRFPGFCSREDIANLVRRSRALVVPGRWREPFGLVIAECVRSGLPVLISEPSTLSADIARLNMGRTFPANSADALAAILREAAADDALIEKMSRNAISMADEICTTTEEWTERFLGLFEEMTAGKA